MKIMRIPVQSAKGAVGYQSGWRKELPDSGIVDIARWEVRP